MSDSEEEKRINDPFNEEIWDYENEYYAFVDNIETLDNNRTIIHFDCVEKDQIDNLKNSDLLTLKYESFKTKMIVCDFSERNFNEFTGFLKNDINENDWIILNLTQDPTRYRVEVYPEYYENIPESLDRYLANNCEKVSEPLSKKLNKIFTLKSSSETLADYTRNVKLKRLSTPSKRRQGPAIDVHVHNVGQGNFISIIGANDKPLAYFDVGGGAYPNAHTYPVVNTKKICFSDNLVIILSHWHYDHWWTFNRLLKSRPKVAVPHATWIVPDQKLGPGQKKFNDLLLKNKQTVIKWPKNKKTESFDFGTIIKCNPIGNNKNINHDGLALLVKSRTFRILLPGDAAYDTIDPKYIGNLSGLVATHHGGSHAIGNNMIPVSNTSPGKILYSYGLKNIYHHPSGDSVIKHCHAGWSNIRETPAGSVSFMATPAQIGFNKDISKYNLGRDCDDAIEQGF
jgi:beta-lactamase superfamily II metal-dependent hydrolase